jgi:hypothetical protein
LELYYISETFRNTFKVLKEEQEKNEQKEKDNKNKKKEKNSKEEEEGFDPSKLKLCADS